MIGRRVTLDDFSWPDERFIARRVSEGLLESLVPTWLVECVVYFDANKISSTLRISLAYAAGYYARISLTTRAERPLVNVCDRPLW